MTVLVDISAAAVPLGLGLLAAVMGLRRALTAGVVIVAAGLTGFAVRGIAAGVFLEEPPAVVTLAGLASFLLPGVAMALGLLVLIRLPPGRYRALSICLGIVLRAALTLAVLVCAAGTLPKLFRPELEAALRGRWQAALPIGAGWIGLAVALNLLLSRLRKWRTQTPRWTGRVAGRILAGAAGFGGGLLLLALLIPALCSPFGLWLQFRRPRTGWGRVVQAPDIQLSPPASLVRAVVATRVASQFLKLRPARSWSAILIDEQLPRIGVRIRSGQLPAGPGQADIRPARLAAGQPQWLVARDSTGFNLLAFQGTDWVCKSRVPFVNPYARPGSGRAAWNVGDVDGDGCDEIVVGLENRLVVLKWQDSSFARREYPFRYQIDNLVVGDVLNEGRNQLVLFASDEELSDGIERMRVCIARLAADSVELVWNDLGELGLGDSRAAPSDELLAVADVENRGANDLLVHRPSSGEEKRLPSCYMLLGWQQGRLRVRRRFSLALRSAVPPQVAADLAIHGEAGSVAVGSLVVGRFSGRTAFIADIFYDREAHRTVLLSLVRGRIRTLGQLVSEAADEQGWADVPSQYLPDCIRAYRSGWPAAHIWVDPDGKGDGLVQMDFAWNAGPGYTFERLVRAPPGPVRPRPAVADATPADSALTRAIERHFESRPQTDTTAREFAGFYLYGTAPDSGGTRAYGWLAGRAFSLRNQQVVEDRAYSQPVTISLRDSAGRFVVADCDRSECPFCLRSGLPHIYPPKYWSLGVSHTGAGEARDRAEQKAIEYWRQRLGADRFVKKPVPPNTRDPHRHDEDIYSHLNLRLYHDSLRLAAAGIGETLTWIPPWSGTTTDGRYVSWNMRIWDTWTDSILVVTGLRGDWRDALWKDNRTLVFDQSNTTGIDRGGAHIELDVPTRRVVWAVPIGRFGFLKRAEPAESVPAARSFTLRGAVADGATRKRLAGASVSVAGSTALADSLGRFEFSGLAVGRYRLQVTCPGYFGRTFEVISAGHDAETANVLLYDSSFGRVAGRVIGTDTRRGVTGLDVSVDNQRVKARVDSGGNYVLDGLRPGAYRLRIFPGGTGYSQTAVDVRVRAGATFRADIHTERFER